MKVIGSVGKKDYYEMKGENYNWEVEANNLRC